MADPSSASTTPRFVILHHVVGGGEHWDLMLERPEQMWTWQLDRDPTEPGTWPVRARRIFDHRKDYLEYEGPISRDRGQVSRVDRGPLEYLEVAEGRCVFRVAGEKLEGVFVLNRLGDDRWLLDRSRT